MHRHWVASALALGTLTLAGCHDLDRELLELGSWAMVVTLICQTVVMLCAMAVPSSSGWRTLGVVVAAFTTAVGIVCAVGAVSLYARRGAWPLPSTLNVALILYGAAALLAMAVRVAVWRTDDEVASEVEAGEPPQSGAFRVTAVGGAVLATVVLVALLAR